MKVAFISDIHGNAVALDAVLDDLKRKQVDKIFVLGDICYRGPEPKRSLELVRSLDADVIKGNADEWVVRGVREGEVPDTALDMMKREGEWIVSQLDRADVDYLKELPEEIRGELGQGLKFHAFHATPESLFQVMLPDTDDQEVQSVMMRADADLYVYGHIHKAFVRYVNGKVLMNLGSVGLPFDGVAKASYGLVEVDDQGGFTTSIQRVPYDIEKVVEQYKEVGYPNVEMMVNIIRSGRNE